MRLRNETAQAIWVTPWGLTRKHPRVWWPGCHRPGQDIVIPVLANANGMLMTPLNPKVGRPWGRCLAVTVALCVARDGCLAVLSWGVGCGTATRREGVPCHGITAGLGEGGGGVWVGPRKGKGAESEVWASGGIARFPLNKIGKVGVGRITNACSVVGLCYWRCTWGRRMRRGMKCQPLSHVSLSTLRVGVGAGRQGVCRLMSGPLPPYKCNTALVRGAMRSPLTVHALASTSPPMSFAQNAQPERDLTFFFAGGLVRAAGASSSHHDGTYAHALQATWRRSTSLPGIVLLMRSTSNGHVQRHCQLHRYL